MPSRPQAAETFEVVRGNLDRLIETLQYLGYLFDVRTRPQAIDWPLEIRLNHAIAYAQSKTPKKSAGTLAVFDHPALAWVREEKIVLPARFAPHPQAPGIRKVEPDTERELQRLEKRAGGPVPPTLRAWFLNCGAVDLRGRHPFLNPQGNLEALHIAPLNECVDGFTDGWLPLSSSWKIRLPDAFPDATLADGRLFLDALRGALHWAGIPGLAAAPAKAERELELVRSRMEAF